MSYEEQRYDYLVNAIVKQGKLIKELKKLMYDTFIYLNKYDNRDAESELFERYHKLLKKKD
jgi:hypothetical protein